MHSYRKNLVWVTLPISLFTAIITVAKTGLLYYIGIGILLQLLYVLIFHYSRFFKETRLWVWELQNAFYGLGSIAGLHIWNQIHNDSFDSFAICLLLTVIFIYLICVHVLLVMTVYFRKL